LVVTFINTDGMAFIGPGSEWFWTALSGLVLATTFVAIYRQLRLQAHASAIGQLNEFDREAASERANRAKLTLLLALQGGTDPVDLPDAAAGEVAGSWEKIATLIRDGHSDPKLLWRWTGSFAQGWWLMLGPWIEKRRVDRGDSTYYTNLEWLAGRMREMDIAAGTAPPTLELLARIRKDVIEELRDLIRTEEALRTVLIAPSPVSPGEVPARAGSARPGRRHPATD
jgi:hypothetical protein